jgi:hypothetical protein
LNDTSQPRQLLGRVVFDISALYRESLSWKRTGEKEQTYLEVSNESLDNSLPCNETFDEDIRRLMSDILFYKGLIAGY